MFDFSYISIVEIMHRVCWSLSMPTSLIDISSDFITFLWESRFINILAERDEPDDDDEDEEEDDKATEDNKRKRSLSESSAKSAQQGSNCDLEQFVFSSYLNIFRWFENNCPMCTTFAVVPQKRQVRRKLTQLLELARRSTITSLKSITSSEKPVFFWWNPTMKKIFLCPSPKECGLLHLKMKLKLTKLWKNAGMSF